MLWVISKFNISYSNLMLSCAWMPTCHRCPELKIFKNWYHTMIAWWRSGGVNVKEEETKFTYCHLFDLCLLRFSSNRLLFWKFSNVFSNTYHKVTVITVTKFCWSTTFTSLEDSTQTTKDTSKLQREFCTLSFLQIPVQEEDQTFLKKEEWQRILSQLVKRLFNTITKCLIPIEMIWVLYM